MTSTGLRPVQALKDLEQRMLQQHLIGWNVTIRCCIVASVTRQAPFGNTLICL